MIASTSKTSTVLELEVLIDFGIVGIPVASLGFLGHPVILKTRIAARHRVRFFNLYFAVALRYRFHLGCCTFFGLGKVVYLLES